MPKIPSNRYFFSLRNLFLVAEFELRSFLFNKGDILRQLFYEPILYVSIFSNALSGLVGGEVLYAGRGVKYVAFAYPGIVGLQLLRIFTQSIYRFTVDSRWGTQALKLSAGTGCLAYGLGTLAVPMGVFCAQSLVSYVVFRCVGGNVSFALFAITAVFGMACVAFWHAVAIFLGFFFKSYARRDLFLNVTILPMTLASPAFYSLDTAPRYVALLAKINPLAYQIRFLRELFLGEAALGSMVFFLLSVAALWAYAIFKLYAAEFYQSRA